ncbi:MAG: iron-sulfur cluster assembly accessory protein [Gemmataceae bacterium]
MTVTLTPRAAEEVKRILQQQRQAGVIQEEKVYLRLSVQGGGCSGFQHRLQFDVQYNEKTDELQEQHGVPLVVDRKSLLYVDGATIDYINDLNRSGFHVSNPNARTTCGCGSSFSV